MLVFERPDTDRLERGRGDALADGVVYAPGHELSGRPLKRPGELLEHEEGARQEERVLQRLPLRRVQAGLDGGRHATDDGARGEDEGDGREAGEELERERAADEAEPRDAQEAQDPKAQLEALAQVFPQPAHAFLDRLESGVNMWLRCHTTILGVYPPLSQEATHVGSLDSLGGVCRNDRALGRDHGRSRERPIGRNSR
ncbi:MAG: hypothetical protein H0T61_00275 [Actinobacteria bacterium]|nr:hypothetical protein [Actinomycetota bacterium]